MAVKSTEGGEEDMYGGMKATAKILRNMRDEPWQRLAWIDQDVCHVNKLSRIQANDSQEHESYQVYHDSLIYQDPNDAPHLVSEMSNEQYLDAISCPRIDPTRQGQKVMAEAEETLFKSEDDDENGEVFNDTEELGDLEEDEEEEGYETLPKDAIRPDDCLTERRIERIARAICTHPAKEQAFYEEQMRQKANNDFKWAKCSFLLPTDRHHVYYQYRLAENRAGRGIDPDYDVFEMIGGDS